MVAIASQYGYHQRLCSGFQSYVRLPESHDNVPPTNNHVFWYYNDCLMVFACVLQQGINETGIRAMGNGEYWQRKSECDLFDMWIKIRVA